MTAYTTIIDAETLYQHYQDPGWVIVDSRFDLANPEWGYPSYLAEHIPGAVYTNLDRDLSGKITAQSGRHPLPLEAKFIALASRLGIDHKKQVVVYDTQFGEIAARFWWMLGLYNHPHVAVLDGGFGQWKARHYPLATGEEHNPEVQFTGTPSWDRLATSVQVETYIHSPFFRLVDSRASERFAGEVEPIDPVAGHIPSAINYPYLNNLNPDGTFLPAEKIQAKFNKIIDSFSPGNVVVYCGSGVTSCFNILALKIAGIEAPRLYAGSWSEWITDSRREVAKG